MSSEAEAVVQQMSDVSLGSQKSAAELVRTAMRAMAEDPSAWAAAGPPAPSASSIVMPSIVPERRMPAAAAPRTAGGWRRRGRKAPVLTALVCILALQEAEREARKKAKAAEKAAKEAAKAARVCG